MGKGKKREYSALGQYIQDLCDAQNLSLRQAALRSGLEGSTISKILRRDRVGTPTPDTLDKIASGIGGDFFHMMKLAGHLPPDDSGDSGSLDAELFAKLRRLEELVKRLAKENPTAAARLMGLIITPFEIMVALEGGSTDEELEEAIANAKEVL